MAGFPTRGFSRFFSRLVPIFNICLSPLSLSASPLMLMLNFAALSICCVLWPPARKFPRASAPLLWLALVPSSGWQLANCRSTRYASFAYAILLRSPPMYVFILLMIPQLNHLGRVPMSKRICIRGPLLDHQMALPPLPPTWSFWRRPGIGPCRCQR